MPTASELALQERDVWLDISERWRGDEFGDLWEVKPPTEKAVVIFYDPNPDLVHRALEWGHVLSGPDLASLAAFASGLADLEAGSWSSADLDVATRAYEARRFLIGDRVLHWAVPWLDAVGRWRPECRDLAHHDRDALLRLGDTMRVAPQLPGSEGLVAIGEDSLGPIEPKPLDLWVTSLWSGALIPDRTDGAGGLRELYGDAANRWERLADRHPGSRQLWLDLASRARVTLTLL